LGNPPKRNRLRGLAQELPHPEVLLEREREELDLHVAPREVGHELAGEQVGVRPRDEHREGAVRPVRVHDLLVALDALHLINEEVGDAARVLRKPRLDGGLELVGRADGPEAALLEVEVHDAALVDPALAELVGYRLHEARLAAAADARHHLDEARVVDEGPDLLEVPLPAVVLCHPITSCVTLFPYLG
jgi:hypothetical protein